jgi:hypothetical protein
MYKLKLVYLKINHPFLAYLHTLPFTDLQRFVSMYEALKDGRVWHPSRNRLGKRQSLPILPSVVLWSLHPTLHLQSQPFGVLQMTLENKKQNLKGDQKRAPRETNHNFKFLT